MRYINMKELVLQQRIHDFALLGTCVQEQLNDPQSPLMQAVGRSQIENPWFLRENVIYALQAWVESLTLANLTSLVEQSDLNQAAEPRMMRVAVIMAGNIPLVGFHDWMCVLLSGHMVVAKQSKNDNLLLPVLAQMLVEINPLWKERIAFKENLLKDFQAVIATGSNNTSRYFDYYFNQYPHIIRHNRSSVALMTGEESREDLGLLCHDIFMHFGLGCRSVNKLYVPKNYDFAPLIEASQIYSHYGEYHLYGSTFDYHKALLLINQQPFIDGGFWLLKAERGLHSPVSVVNYETYDSTPQLLQELASRSEELQCVVGNLPATPGLRIVEMGTAQNPQLWDYADGVNTLDFLASLSKK